MLRQIARSARLLRPSYRTLSVTATVCVPKVVTQHSSLLRQFSSSVTLLEQHSSKKKNPLVAQEIDEEDEELAALIKASGHGDKLQPHDWYTAVRQKNSTAAVKEKLQKVENDVARFSSNVLAMEYFSDFPSMLEISIEQYGDEILKPIIEEDLELNEAYEQDRLGTYSNLILQGITGLEAADVREERLATIREEITDNEVFAKVKHIEKLIESVREEGFDDQQLQQLFEVYYQLPKPRAKLLSDIVLEDFLVVTNEIVADFFEEEQYQKYDLGLSVENLSDIYIDVLESDMKLTSEEHLKFLRLNLVTAPEFNEQIYLTIVQGLESENIQLDTRFYSVFLHAALHSANFSLFDKIIFHLYQSGIDLDRRLFRVLNDYYSLKNDVSSWLNLWNLRVDVYKYPISRVEYRDYINSLIYLGEKQLAHSLLSASLYVKLQCLNSEEYFAVANDLVKNKDIKGVAGDFSRFIQNTGADLSGEQDDLQNLITSSSVQARKQLEAQEQGEVAKSGTEEEEANQIEFSTHVEEKMMVDEMVEHDEPYDIIDFIYSDEMRKPYMHLILPEGDFFQMFFVTSENIDEMQQYYELMISFGVDLDFPNINVLLEEFSDREVEWTPEILGFFQAVVANIFKYEDSVEYLLLDVDVLMNFNNAINHLFDSGLVDTDNDAIVENKRLLENYIQDLSDSGLVYNEEVLNRMATTVFALSGLDVERVNNFNNASNTEE